MVLETDQTSYRAAQYVRMSTEHQQYSTNNQADKILEYAQRRNIEIVRTYADEGKSGLSLGGRASLQKLLSDVEAGLADFSLVLVYDVSRWGRFQDADEAAFHEYKLRRKGIPVFTGMTVCDFIYAISGVFRALEADRDMALCAQVIDFVRLGFLHDAHQVAGVGQVAVVQFEVGIVNVRVLVDVVHPLGVKRAGPALDAMHDVAFFQQKLSQVRAVLAGDAGDQSNLGLLCSAEC